MNFPLPTAETAGTRQQQASSASVAPPPGNDGGTSNNSETHNTIPASSRMNANATNSSNNANAFASADPREFVDPQNCRIFDWSYCRVVTDGNRVCGGPYGACDRVGHNFTSNGERAPSLLAYEMRRKNMSLSRRQEDNHNSAAAAVMEGGANNNSGGFIIDGDLFRFLTLDDYIAAQMDANCHQQYQQQPPAPLRQVPPVAGHLDQRNPTTTNVSTTNHPPSTTRASAAAAAAAVHHHHHSAVPPVVPPGKPRELRAGEQFAPFPKHDVLLCSPHKAYLTPANHAYRALGLPRSMKIDVAILKALLHDKLKLQLNDPRCPMPTFWIGADCVQNPAHWTYQDKYDCYKPGTERTFLLRAKETRNVYTVVEATEYCVRRDNHRKKRRAAAAPAPAPPPAAAAAAAARRPATTETTIAPPTTTTTTTTTAMALEETAAAADSRGAPPVMNNGPGHTMNALGAAAPAPEVVSAAAGNNNHALSSSNAATKKRPPPERSINEMIDSSSTRFGVDMSWIGTIPEKGGGTTTTPPSSSGNSCESMDMTLSGLCQDLSTGLSISHATTNSGGKSPAIDDRGLSSSGPMNNHPSSPPPQQDAAVARHPVDLDDDEDESTLTLSELTVSKIN